MALSLQAPFGRYKILRKLGEGGMGAVYLAEDTRLTRKVALKVPRFAVDESPHIIERFLREARLAALIHHPSLCAIYDVDCIDGTHYLTMAFIEGTPLSSLLGRARIWTPAQAIPVICQLATVLQLLHDKGIIHRDLKPSNVMIRSDGTPVLMDFGLARSFLPQSHHMTTAGKLVGTPSFMAPEQVLADEANIGPATDVYALGVVLYQLLTGELPITGNNPMELFARILEVHPLPPSIHQPGLDARLDDICLRALAKTPQQRPASMHAFAQLLQGMRRRTEMPLQPPPPPPAPPVLPVLPAPPSPAPLSIPPELHTTTPSQHLLTIPPAPTPPRRWTPLLIVAALVFFGLFVAIGLIVATSGGTTAPSTTAAPLLRLHVPAELTVAPGEQQTLGLRLERQACPGEVRLVHDGAVDELQVHLAPFQGDATYTEIRVRAAKDARVGRYNVHLIAIGPGNERSEASLAVTVRAVDMLPKPSLHLPPLAEVTLQPGQTHTLAVTLERMQYEGEVKLLLDGTLDAIQVRLEPFAASETKTTVTLKANADATAGRYRVRLVALGTGNLRAEVQIPVVVASGHAKRLTNSIDMELALIPAGKYTRGSPENEKDRDEEEGPQHEVELTRSFYLGRHEVTQSDYQQVMGKNPSHFSALGVGSSVVKELDTKRFPVENVSYDEAVEFCRKLTELAAEKKAGRRYRLPTEAEWEYACRAGSPTYQIFHGGDSFTSTDGNCDGSLPYGNARRGENLQRTATVGGYRANAFGLHDLHGNVWEWCSDWYDGNYYQRSPVKDPTGPDSGKERVLRGGSWFNLSRACRTAQRFHLAPTTTSNFVGFRVVCDIPDP